jgi:hypothetical protein
MLLTAYGFSEEELCAFSVAYDRARWQFQFDCYEFFIFPGGCIMGCFVVPVAEAVITAIIMKAVKSKEAELKALKVDTANGSFETESKILFSKKLKWLSNMLWGGSALLAFEHVWHGEVVPWFPFMTAASDPVGTMVMLSEMMTVGVSMAALVTAAWGVMLIVTSSIEKKALKAQIASR